MKIRPRGPHDKYLVPVVAKALDVLECFSAPAEELTLEQIRRRTSIPHTTVFRLLHTLVLRGYLLRDGARYRLSSSRRKFRIGFANLSRQIALAREIEASLAAAARSAGVELLLWDNDRDVETALRNAREMAASGVDAAIEFQLYETAAPVISETFASRGIPLISIVNPQHGTLYFGVDNYRAGLTAGLALVRHAEAGWGVKPGTVVLLESRRAGPTVQSRLDGALAAIERRFGTYASSAVVHVEGGGGRETAAGAVGRLLASAPKSPIAIAAVNDESALGAADAVAAHRSRRRIAIVGQGGSPEIIALARSGSGPCIGTVNFHAEAYGPELIDFVIAVLQGRAIPPARYMPHSFEGPGGALAALPSVPRRSSI